MSRSTTVEEINYLREGDARALAELAACLVAYNISADGTVTPSSRTSCRKNCDEMCQDARLTNPVTNRPPPDKLW